MHSRQVISRYGIALVWSEYSAVKIIMISFFCSNTLPSLYRSRSLRIFDVGIQECIKLHDNMTAGGRLNKKDGLTRYGNSHVKDKTS